MVIHLFPDVTVCAVVCVQFSAIPCEAGVLGAQLPDHNPQQMPAREWHLRIPGRVKSNTGAELLAKTASGRMCTKKIQSFARWKEITWLVILEDHACEPTHLNSNRIFLKI